MSQPQWDYIAKLVCIGDSGTGKSSLTIRLCEGRFSPYHDVTIGVEFGSRVVQVHDPSPSPLIHTPDPDSSENQEKRMKLSIWDTAGQETYASVTRSYFRGASGALLVFSLTRRASFESVTRWLNDLRQIAEPSIVVVLVGNKLDLANKTAEIGAEGAETGREVTTEEATRWCRENGVMKYVETSAKSGENVEMAFREVADRIYANIMQGQYDLNDRRSGVKGPGAGKAGKGDIRLKMNDAAKGGGWGGKCC